MAKKGCCQPGCEVECISRMNSWNKMIFYMMLQTQESCINGFWVGVAF